MVAVRRFCRDPVFRRSTPRTQLAPPPRPPFSILSSSPSKRERRQRTTKETKRIKLGIETEHGREELRSWESSTGAFALKRWIYESFPDNIQRPLSDQPLSENRRSQSWLLLGRGLGFLFPDCRIKGLASIEGLVAQDGLSIVDDDNVYG